MKLSRPVIVGAALAALGLVLVLTTDPGGDEATGQGEETAVPESGKTAATAPREDTKHSRKERTKGSQESPDAKSLKLLWARGRGQELLVALDQLSERADDDDWRQVADVLVEQAASDGRHEIATYLLATGHGAPGKVRLSIYAAALENPDEGIRASAKLELLNLTGQQFKSRQEADEWIATHPQAVGENDDAEE